MPILKNQLTVSIRGPVKSGKTKLANAVSAAAGLLGLDVVINDGSMPDETKTTSKRTIVRAMAFFNGNIAVCDARGNQIPELQVGWPNLWAKLAESLGYDPDGVVFELQGGGKFRIFRCGDGSFNREML